MKSFRQYINESLNKPYEYDDLGSMENDAGEREHHYGFKDRKGIPTHVYITHHAGKAGEGKASVDFTDEHGNVDATGRGTIRHISTVKKIMRDHAARHSHLKNYVFSGEKDPDKKGGGSRHRLYAHLAKKFGGKTIPDNAYSSKYLVPINR